MLNDREKKCLEHALSGANENEADNAAVVFFRLLRKRQVTVVQFVDGLSSLNGSGAPPPVKSTPDWGMTVMPFRKSKHYGKMFMDIPARDLESTDRWINSDPEIAKRFKSLSDAIRAFFKQCRS